MRRFFLILGFGLWWTGVAGALRGAEVVGGDLLSSEGQVFSPVSSSQALSSLRAGSVKRTRWGRWRPEGLVVGANGVPVAGQRVGLNWFDGQRFEADLARVESSGPGVWQASGRVRGVEGSLVVLSAQGDGVAGEATLPGKGRFLLSGSLSGGVKIEELGVEVARCLTCRHVEGTGDHEHGLLLSVAESGVESRLGKQSVAPVLPPTSEVVTLVDLLVVYTAQAVAGAGGEEPLQAMIQLATAEANAVFQNSRAHVRLRVVHQQLMPSYVEDERFATNLARLRLPDDGFLDEVHALRESRQADLVCLITENGDTGYGGLASVMPVVGPASKPFGFSVVRRADAVGHYVFVHEIGHNFGLQHDRENSLDPKGSVIPGVFHYSFGYRFVSEGTTYRTVMAYPPGEQVPFLSTPLIRFQQEPLGVDASLTNSAADNVRTINTTAPVVGAYGGVLTQTRAPGLVWVSPEDGSEGVEGEALRLRVNATDSDGTVKQVEFYNGQELLGVVSNPSSANVEWVWANAHAGIHSLTARVVDQLGACSALVSREVSVRPVNDLFARRAVVSGDSWVLKGSNAAATREAGEPTVGANVGDGSVWYEWTAPRQGSVRILGRGVTSIPLVGAFRGVAVGDLAVAYRSVVFDVEQRTCVVSADVVGGQTVMISVDSSVGFDDRFELSLEYSNVPANDEFVSRSVVAGETVRVEGRNDSATVEAGEPKPMGNAGGKSVWYEWTAPRSGVVGVLAAGTNAFWLVDAYVGTGVGGTFNGVGGLGAPLLRHYFIDRTNALSRVVFTAVAGQAYAVVVDGAGGASGVFELGIEYLPRLANDLFEGREEVSGTNVVWRVNNLAATVEVGEPLPAGNPGGKSVWYRWTAPVSGPVKVQARGSGFTVLPDAFEGSSVTNLVPVNRGIQTLPGSVTELTFTAVLGVTYQLVIDGFSGRGGDIEVSLVTRDQPAQLIGGTIEQAVREGGGGVLRFRIGGSVGQGYRVERSRDLVVWETFELGTIDASPKVYEVLIGGTSGDAAAVGFYRVRAR